MKAVVVAAGKGLRMQGVTQDQPKCLLEVGGQTILQRALAILSEAGINQVFVVVGHKREEVAASLGNQRQLPCTLLLNPFYETTNNMASLWFARAHVEGGSFLYLHGDLLFHHGILERVLEASGGTVFSVADCPYDEEAMKVKLTPDGYFAGSSKSLAPEESAGEWIGLARFAAVDTRPLFDSIEELLLEGKHDEYDTAAFSRLASRGRRFGIAGTCGLPYIEVDTPQDLARARELFPPDSTGGPGQNC